MHFLFSPLQTGQKPRSNSWRPLCLLFSTALLTSACASAPKPAVPKSAAQLAENVPKASPVVQPVKKTLKQSISDEELVIIFNPVIARLKSCYIANCYWDKTVIISYDKLRDIISQELDDSSTRNEPAKIKIALAATAISDLFYNFFMRRQKDYEYGAADKVKDIKREIDHLISKIVKINEFNKDSSLESRLADLREATEKYPSEDFESLFFFFGSVYRIIFAPGPNYKSANELPELDGATSPYCDLLNWFIRRFNAIQQVRKDEIDFNHNFPHKFLNKRFPFLPLRGLVINPNLPETKFLLSPPFDKPVVINLWGVGCGPCMHEMPDFDRIYKSGIAFVVGYQIPFDGATYNRSQLEELQNAMPVVSYPLVNGSDKESYKVWEGTIGSRTVPITLILDKDGKVKMVIVGGTSEEELRDVLNNLPEHAEGYHPRW